MAQHEIVIRSQRDVIDLINRGVIRGGNSLAIVLIALGGTFIDAYDFTSLGIGAVQLREQFHLTAFALGTVTAAMALGALVGALFGGYYVDKIGRLRMFLLDLAFFVVAAIGAALSTNYYVLIAFRLLMGVGVGLDFPVALSFVAEYTAVGGKGKYVNLWQSMWYIAATCVFLAILPLYLAGVGPALWRWAVGLGAVPALAVLILRYIYMDESPMWAAHQGDLREVARIIGKSYGIRVTVAPEARAGRPLAEVYSWKNYAKIFSPPYRLRTLLASIIAPTQSMEYFAVGFYLPVISLAIFGKEFINAILGAAFFNLFGILGGTWQAFLTDRVGVRRLAIIGYSLVILSLISIGVGFGHIPTPLAAALIALFIFSHSFGPGSQGMTMAALSFPTSIRGAGTGWTQAVLRAGSILGFYFFPLLRQSLTLGTTLLFLTIVPLIGLLACLLIRWEPIGKDVDAEDFEAAAVVGRAAPEPGASA